MSATATLAAPSGTTQVVDFNGTVYLVDGSGNVTVPVGMVARLLNAGFLLEAIQPGSITDAEVSASAAIAYSKLALTGNIVNADLAAGAAVALSKIVKLLNDRVLNTVGLAIGTTVTLAFGAFDYQVGAASGGVNTFKHKAAVSALAFGALGTISASTWGIIVPQIAADGTVTFKSGAANYTTGYASEAAAIAALPVADAARAPMGYVTILASSSTWVAGTDALAGGTGGNPATTTNYYNAGLNY